jgi:hypothetical protein
MPGQLISRKAIGWVIIITLVVLVAVFGSFTSRIVGIYYFPDIGLLDGSTSYLVHNRGVWYHVMINGSSGPHVKKVDSARVTLTPGIWLVRGSLPDGGEFYVRPTFNLIDVYQIVLGKYRSQFPP